MDLPTYTSIWRIEKRLYKLYDFRLPMPLPVATVGVCVAIAVVWILLMRLVNMPWEQPWHVVWIVPPFLLGYVVTRPVVEGKRLTELMLSYSRYLFEARVYCRLAPEREPRNAVVTVRVWHRHPDAGPLPAVRESRAVRRRERHSVDARAPERPRAVPPPLSLPSHTGEQPAAEPVEAEPVEAEPVEAEPVQAESMEAEPVQATVAEVAPPAAEWFATPVDAAAPEEQAEPKEQEDPALEQVEVVEPVETLETVESAAEADAYPAEFVAERQRRPSLLRRGMWWLGFGLPEHSEPAAETSNDTRDTPEWHGHDAVEPGDQEQRRGSASEYVRLLRREERIEGRHEYVDEVQLEEERKSGEWFAQLRTSTGETPLGLSSQDAHDSDSDTAAMPAQEPEQAPPEPQSRELSRERRVLRRRAEEIMSNLAPGEAAEWLAEQQPAARVRPEHAENPTEPVEPAGTETSAVPAERNRDAELRKLRGRARSTTVARQLDTQRPQHESLVDTDAPADPAAVPSPSHMPAEAPREQPDATPERARERAPIPPPPQVRGYAVPAEGDAPAKPTVSPASPPQPLRRPHAAPWELPQIQLEHGTGEQEAFQNASEAAGAGAASSADTSSSDSVESTEPTELATPPAPTSGEETDRPEPESKSEPQPAEQHHAEPAAADPEPEPEPVGKPHLELDHGTDQQHTFRQQLSPERHADSRGASTAKRAQSTEADPPDRRRRADWFAEEGMRRTGVPRAEPPQVERGKPGASPDEASARTESTGHKRTSESQLELSHDTDEQSTFARVLRRFTPDRSSQDGPSSPNHDGRPTLDDIEQAERDAFERRRAQTPDSSREAPDEPERSPRLARRIQPQGTAANPTTEDPADGDAGAPAETQVELDHGTGEHRALRAVQHREAGDSEVTEVHEDSGAPPVRALPKPRLQLDHGTGEQAGIPRAGEAATSTSLAKPKSSDDAPSNQQETRQKRPRNTHPAAQGGAPSTEQPTEQPTDPSQGRRRGSGASGRGLRRLANVVTGGQDSPAAELSPADLERVCAPLGGQRRVVVLGCTGGAGQTSTVLVLGHTLASLREERIVAVDLNPGETGLSRRVPPESPETLTSLLANIDRVEAGGYTLMRNYTSQTATGLEALAALDDPYVHTLDDRDLNRMTTLLGRHYPLALLDPAATGVARTLPQTDSLVLVAPASADAARAVAMTFEWLDGHGYAGLRARSIVVVNGVSKRSLPDVEAAEQVARGSCRAIVRVPWDDHVPGGHTLDFGSLRASTRRAHGALAGVLVTSLAQ